MRVTCERCLRRYDVPDATVKGRKIRARCKCGARVVVQDEERAARSSSGGSQTTGSIQRPVRWFVDITSWEPIAMDLRQLVRAFDGGRIDADTLVWRKGMPDWRRLRDVAELAERLMGADAAKAATVPEAAFEPLRSESEPPRREPDKQPERSRTPPANYSVTGGDRTSSPPVDRISVSSDDVRFTDVNSPGGTSNLGPGKEEAVVATLPGGSMPATPAGGYSSPAPPRTSARPERRSVPSPRPGSLAGLAAGGGATPRTITQTGLAPAPDPEHRLVQGRTQSQDAAEAPITEEPEANRNGAAALGSPRAARTPAPGPRRVPSSDETPAQKPSAISVPSGGLAPAPSQIRIKHLVALGGLVLGLGLIVRGTLSSEQVPGAPPVGSAAPAVLPTLAPEPPHIENRVENRSALVPEPLPAPAPQLAPSPEPAAVPAPVSSRPVPPAAVPPARAARPAPVLPIAPSKPAASATPTAQASILDIRPSESAPAAALAAGTPPAAPVTGRGELGAPATPPPPEPVAPVAAPSTPGAGTPGAGTPGAGAPDSTPPPAAPVTPQEAAPAPAPFDAQRARVQLGIAAFKASTCGSLGGARGAGDVTVVIESFGRVTRVTHTNPAFVGTPIGACVTQAYQQVQVAPFGGAPQTLTSSFVVP